MKFSLFLLMLTFGAGVYWVSSAQNRSNLNIDEEGYCAQDRLHEQRLLTDTAYAQRQAAMEAQILASHRMPTASRLPVDYTLPVVFHIIHNGGPENIPDQQVLDALQHLNDAFANVGYYDPNTGVDIQIDFCLAQRDPDSLASNGINRVQSPLTNFNADTQDQELKDLSRWDSREYINIWIVEDICDNTGCDVAGYAYSPGAHGQPYDGIVVEAEFTGSSPTNSTYLVHEMGHYLGLYHTFRGGCANGDCLSDGDLICDTPPDNTTASPPCDLPPNSCSSDEDDTSLNNPFRAQTLGGLGDQPDPIENYMDYSKRECYNQFTQGQKDRMQDVVAGIRSSLLQSMGCVEACPGYVNAEFTASTLSITLGGTIDFTNASINADSFQWLIDGVPFSMQVNTAYTFLNEGQFEIKLIAYSDLYNCPPSDVYSLTVNAYCPVEAAITPGGMIVAPGESVEYTNQSQNVEQISWQINEVEVSTEQTYTLQTSTPGLYTLCLIADNGFCQDKQCVTLVANIPGSGTELEICDNGLDEDGDGLIDCEDPDCPCLEDCSGTFVQLFGQPGVSQDNILGSLSETSDGGVLFGGMGFGLGTNLGYLGTLTKITTEGNIAWARVLDLSGFFNMISSLDLDDQDLVLGIDNSSNVFRYDPINDTLLWNTHFMGTSLFYSIRFNSETGNYLTCGSSSNRPQLMEINKSTGEVLWQKTFVFEDMQATNGFFKIALANDYFYTMGPVKLEGSSSEYRMALSLIGPGGELAFSKFYFTPLEGTDNQIGGDLLVESDGLIVSVFGNAIGIDPYRTFSTKLLKTDFSGNPLWVKQYYIEDGSFQGYPSLQKIEDGYFLFQRAYYSTTENTVLVLIKTDFEGNVLWAYRYGHENVSISQGWATASTNLEKIGNYLYFFGSVGLEEKGIVFKTNLDGTMDNDCGFFHPVNILTEPLTDTYVGDLNFSEVELPVTEPTYQQVEHWDRYDPFTYFCSPSLCDTLCFYDFRASVDTSYCNGDSLMVALDICNESENFYEGVINVAFYLGNPTNNEKASFFYQVLLPDLSLDSNACQIFQLNIPYPDSMAYVIINDNGNYLPPFDPAQILPLLGITECAYDNNVDSFFYESIVPELNLGPDVSICENSSLVLDAGPGFAEYRWNTGETEQTNTITTPGPYWVVATTICGVTKSDLIQVSLDASIGLEMDSLWICSGDTTVLSVPEVDGYEYQWYPEDDLTCANCPTTSLLLDSSRVYTLIAHNENGCYSVDSIALILVESPILELADGMSSCIPESGALTVEILAGNGPFEINWSDGQEGALATGLNPGEYMVTVTDFFGCQSIAFGSILLEEPVIILPREYTINFGDSLQIVPEISGGEDLVYFWEPGQGLSCQDCPNPIANPLTTTQYNLQVEDSQGCTASANTTISVERKLRVYIPTAFSPNGDQVNDELRIYTGPEVSEIVYFRIFNRWGGMVHEVKNQPPNSAAIAWDGRLQGKLLNTAVFVYRAEVRFVDGTSEIFEGDVVLLR